MPRDVAIFDGHTPAGFVEQAFLLSPHVCNGHGDPVNSSLECIYTPRQPGLEDLTLPSILGAHPVGQFSDDDGARVTAVLFIAWLEENAGPARGGAAAHRPG